MAFDRDKFLKALLSSDLPNIPSEPATAPSVDFAKWLNAHSFGVPNMSTDAAIASVKREEQKNKEREEGFLSKTFGWMMSLGNMNENILMDAYKPNTSTGDKLKNIGIDVAAGVGNAVNPLLELATPGFNHPLEEQMAEFYDKHNKEYHGTGPISGSRLLEERAGWTPDSTSGRVAKALAGFGVDVAVDPTTYIGGLGALSKSKRAAQGVEDAVKIADNPVEEALSAAAGASHKGMPPPVGDPSPFQTTPLVPKHKDVLRRFSKQDINPVMPTDNYLADAIRETNITGLNPAAARSARASKASAVRWGKDDPPLFTSADFKNFTAQAGKGQKWLKESKTSQVITKDGINPIVVEKTIEDIARGVTPAATPIDPVSDATFRKLSDDVAETLQKGMGKSGRRSDLTPPNQANLYNAMYKKAAEYLEANPSLRGKPTLKRNQQWLRSTALAMTRAGEDYLAKSHGLIGKHWDGGGLRLTDVIAHLGPNALDEHVTRVLDAFKFNDPSFIKDPVAKVAITKAMAQRNLEMSGVTKVILDGYTEKVQIAKNTLSTQKYRAWKEKAIETGGRDAQLSGATKEEAKAVIDLLRGTVDVRELELMEPQKVMDAIGPKMVEAVIEGRANPELIQKLNKAIAKQLGETPKSMLNDIMGTSVVDSMMMRMTTWYGRGEHVHFAREGYSLIEQNAKARAAWFSNAFKGFSEDQKLAAFTIAQDVYRTYDAAAARPLIETVSPEVRRLAGQIRDYFDNVVGSKSVFGQMGGEDGVLAIRMGLTMEDIDKQLKAVGSNFQFSQYKRAKKSIHGSEVDYTDNWLQAWENVDGQKLGQSVDKFMYDFDLAVGRVATEYSLIDDLMMRFGALPTDSHFNPATYTDGIFTHHRIPPEMRFPKEVANSFLQLQKDIEAGPWIPKAKPAKMYFKALRIWKSGVTIYNPAHHIRNLIGDTWLMWAAGINDPRTFDWSWKIINSQRPRYAAALNDPTLDALRGVISKSEFERTLVSPKNKVLTKHGANLTAEELYGEAYQRGLLRDAARVEDIIGEPLFANAGGKNKNALQRFASQPLGGKAHNVASTVAEVREHYIRLAHFTGYVNKHLTPALSRRLQKAKTIGERRTILKDVYDKASQEVNKWHPDGRDLTRFEQQWGRALIPFYAWQRKAIPLLFQTMAQRPAKIVAYPRANYALQEMLGVESPAASDPFPQDQLFPDWIMAGGIGPIGDPESDNAVSAWWGKLGRNLIGPNGEEQGYTVVDPGNPFNDTVSEFMGMGRPEDTIKGVGGILTPAFNIPRELISGQKSTGAPIPESQGGDGYLPWATEQVPIAAMLQRILEPGEEHAQGVEPGINTQSLINMLTALGIQGTGPYIKSAEFDARDWAKREKNK